MMLATTLRDRLPSALAALALQAGFFALLALSFVVERHLPAEKEMIFYLPRATIKPPPVVIDGRKVAPRATTARPPFVPPLAPLSGFTNPTLAAPQRGAAPGSGEGLRPKRRDETQELLNPLAKAKDEQHWADELTKEREPPRVPCTSTTHGTVGFGASARPDMGVRLDLVCVARELFGGSPPPPPQVHVTDSRFQAALAAANARHGVRAAPALTSGPQQEGDHAQAHTDIPGGGAAAGPAGPPFGKAGR